MENQVAVGRFGSPYGVKGWIKIISYTDPIERILDYLPWYIVRGNTKFLLTAVKGKIHGDNLIVQFKDCQDRDIAKTYTNLEIYIDREQLPPLSDDEYYWVDLIGLQVFNREEEKLGEVVHLFSTGSNDVLIVKDDTGKERYIPYLQNVILNVDLAKKKLTVDWDATF